MATSKKKGGIKVVHKEQREQIPANIMYRVVSQTHGNVTPDGIQLGRIIGYTENYADADVMAIRHVRNVSKVSAKIDTIKENVWKGVVIVQATDSKKNPLGIEHVPVIEKDE